MNLRVRQGPIIYMGLTLLLSASLPFEDDTELFALELCKGVVMGLVRVRDESRNSRVEGG